MSIDARPSPEQEFQEELNDPISWLNSAADLAAAAELLRAPIKDYWNSVRNGITGRHMADNLFRPYYLLFGFALENLLKGIIIANGYKCVNKKGRFKGFKQGHDLLQLAIKAKVYKASEERILQSLTNHTYWYGRYPGPTDCFRMFESRVLKMSVPFETGIPIYQQMIDRQRKGIPDFEDREVVIEKVESYNSGDLAVMDNMYRRIKNTLIEKLDPEIRDIYRD